MRSRIKTPAAWVALALFTIAGCAESVPRERLLLLEQGRGEYEAKRYTSAISKLTQIIEAGGDLPETTEALYLRGMSHALSGQRGRGYADLEAASRSGASREAAWRANVVLGTLRFEDSNWAGAAENLRLAAANMPASPPRDTVIWRLGLCYERLGRWSEARGSLTELVSKYPTSSYSEAANRRLRLGAEHFSVQCGAFTQPENAANLRLQLQRKNLSAFTNREQGPNGTRYVVLVGKYATYAEAQRNLQAIRAHASDAILWP